MYKRQGLNNPDANPQAIPTVKVSESSVVHVDAHHGFCPLALKFGEVPLVQKARLHGIAALAIHNTYNIAALWREIERLAEQGLVAFSLTASNAYVAPAGGKKPL